MQAGAGTGKGVPRVGGELSVSESHQKIWKAWQGEWQRVGLSEADQGLPPGLPCPGRAGARTRGFCSGALCLLLWESGSAKAGPLLCASSRPTAAPA